MEEQWKPIKGYEGLYEVSNMGRVKSFNYYNAGITAILHPGIDGGGYQFVILQHNGNKKHYKVHRLVAEHFIQNPHDYKYVNHKNEIKIDNNVNNLEWCTLEYNINYGTRTQRATAKNTNGKCSKKVYQYDLNGNLVDVFPSVMEIARKFGYSPGNISMCCRGERNIAYGYIWKYKATGKGLCTD